MSFAYLSGHYSSDALIDVVLKSTYARRVLSQAVLEAFLEQFRYALVATVIAVTRHVKFHHTFIATTDSELSQHATGLFIRRLSKYVFKLFSIASSRALVGLGCGDE